MEKCPANLPDGKAVNSSARAVSIPLNLVEQAVDLDRSKIMKQVVGPPMTEFLQPIYREPLSEEELARLPELDSIADLRTFNLVTRNILDFRMMRQLGGSAKDEGFGAQLRNLAEIRKGTFFYHTADGIIDEGIESGVYTPLTIAWQIYFIENNIRRVRDEGPIDFAQFIEIMQRPEFDKILSSLTRGPNGFLGEKATSFEPHNEVMFEFYESRYDYRSEKTLKVKDSYKVVEGKVVGLSDAFYLAASRKRRQVGDKPSSGCPVRHSFENEAGEKQEPLIITAKNFLVKTIETIIECQQLAA